MMMMMAFNDGGIAALIYTSVVVSKTIQFTAFSNGDDNAELYSTSGHQ